MSSESGSTALAPIFAAALACALQACSAASAGQSTSDRGSGSAAGAGGTGPSGLPIDPNGPGADPSCDSTLEVTYRDFNETHPDFEMPFRGDVVRRMLLEPVLGSDRTPVFRDRVGCFADLQKPLGCTNGTVSAPVISSAESFAEWYHTTPSVNIEIPGTITLNQSPPGSGEYLFESTAFFPLSPSDGFGVTPAGNPLGKNFLFTTEIHVSFGYLAGQKFAFRGDDDLWIFINGRLALDLGSVHGPAEGVIDFDAQAQSLGISPGNTYAMDVFHAERHTDGSNFKFTTNISCFSPGSPK